MLQGICIDTPNTMVLTEGVQYFLFPNGPYHYYVSLFPNEGAHTGCFKSDYFRLIDKESTAMSELDREKIYLAHMYRKEGYPSLELREYFIKPRKTHCNIYLDKELTQHKGCFPLDWFIDFEEIVTKRVENVTETTKSVPIVEEIEFRSTENGQLLLF